MSCCESATFVITSLLGCFLCSAWEDDGRETKQQKRLCLSSTEELILAQWQIFWLHVAFQALIYLWVCAFCPLGRSRECSCGKRWAQAGAHRLAFGHWHMRQDRWVQIQTRNDSPVYSKGHSLYYFWASKYLWSLSIYHITCATPSHLSFSLTSSQWHSMWATCGILQETSHCMKFSLVILQNM